MNHFPTLLASELRQIDCPGNQGARLASEDDFGVLDLVNAEVVADAGGESVFMRQREDFFSLIIDAGGAISLISEDDVPVGYSVAVPAGGGVPAFREAVESVGVVFGTAIRPGFRGRGWQRRMIKARRNALLEHGCERLQAVCAPENHRSLSNLVSMGFQVVAHLGEVHGSPRFLTEFRPAGSSRLDQSSEVDAAVTLPPGGLLAEHESRLLSGKRGVRFVSGPEPALVYSQAELQLGVE
ncbi:MAG: GNAT family N-acetyltransferase [Pseudomonadota bacterium]